jgi:hypothetical protein
LDMLKKTKGYDFIYLMILLRLRGLQDDPGLQYQRLREILLIGSA